MKKSLYILLTVLLFFGGGYVWYAHEKPEDFSGYREIRVEKGDIVKSVQATGVIKPSVGAEVTIGARMSGIVVEEPVEVGDHVKRGDLIARIDDRDVRASLKIAREQFAKLKESGPKEIHRLESAVRRKEIALEEANVTREAALADKKTAQWLCMNKRRLFEHKSGPEREFRVACNDYTLKKAAWRKAQAAYERAKQSLAEARLSLQKARSDYRHDLKIAEERIEQAKIRLSYSVIEAPFEGIITYVSTQKGETVVAGLNAPKFVKILDPGAIENRIYVDETEIGKVRTGMKVQFRVDSYPDKEFTGKIAQIYPQPEIQNGIVYYIAVVKGFENPERLRPEMTTHDKVILEILKNVVRVPNGAVKFKNGRFYVYLKSGNRIREIPVKTGVSDSRYTRILEGVSAGDTILMASAHAD
ncbi:efflux RND transporter periplasmic adaptor subunit [Hydrogenimonas urashimensis]|uniref:efflux RND transporter periplasmic adaptor subunit n=1 Tax=Hydrogenimonas urashimensis TaxID=2740515 RepID=UPI001915AE8D|nr:efflux RND transporter periplasmic adaptor subunit [Hydrogenimonas urashimensis]